MAKTPYAARKSRHGKNRSIANYTALVGQVVYASNELHATFWAIFLQMMKNLTQTETSAGWEGYDVAQQIWHSLRSDDIQRTMVKAVAYPLLESKPRERKALIWAVQAAGKISEYRNDAVHTSVVLVTAASWRRGQFVEPGVGHPQRIEKLRRVGALKLFRLALGDLAQLEWYATAILERMRGERGPLPRRPTLRSIRLVQQNPPMSNKRPPQKAKRKPRRLSSLE
jgi:hypothetical protein